MSKLPKCTQTYKLQNRFAPLDTGDCDVANDGTGDDNANGEPTTCIYGLCQCGGRYLQFTDDAVSGGQRRRAGREGEHYEYLNHL